MEFIDIHIDIYDDLGQKVAKVKIRKKHIEKRLFIEVFVCGL